MKLVYTPRVENLEIEIGDKTVVAPIKMDLSTTAEINDMCRKATEDVKVSDAEMQAAIDAQDGQALLKATTKAAELSAPVVRKMLGEQAYSELLDVFGYSVDDIPVNCYRLLVEIIRAVGTMYKQQTAVSREKAAHYLQEAEDARAAADRDQ